MVKPITNYKLIFGFALNVIGGASMKYWPEVDWFGWPLLICGLVLLGWALIDFVANYLRWSFYPNWSFGKTWLFKSVFPCKILIPLDKAALSVYEANKGGSIEALSGKLNDGEDGRLQWVAEQLVSGKELYGLYSTISNETKLVDQDKMGTLSLDCNTARDMTGNITYRELKISRRDCREYLKQSKSE